MRSIRSRGFWGSRGFGGVWCVLLGVVVWLGVLLVFVSGAFAGFGLQRVGVSVVGGGGLADVQAGSHPFSVTAGFVLHKFPFDEETLKQLPLGQGALKEVVTRLPPGFVGDPDATPKCSYAEFIDEGRCPPDTAVGVDTVYIHNLAAEAGSESEIESAQSSVYNMEPSPGEPAEFAFMIRKTAAAFLNASVRTGEDYGITVTAPGISEAASVYAAKVTLWGVPAEASHDRLRGQVNNGGCIKEHEAFGEAGLAGSEFDEETPGLYESSGECSVNVPVQPFLTNPTSCGVPRKGSFTVSSWQEPGFVIAPSTEPIELPVLSGCEKLDFSPTISVTPDGGAGSTPTGLNVDLHVPQESTINPVGLGEADVRDISVALPAGVQVSPSASDGLQVCSLAQIGLESPGKPSCPDASKVAVARIKTPLLEQELEGAVYLAAPQNFLGGPLENPFASLFAVYLVAEDPVAGVLVKLAGKVTLNETTGQISTSFENVPQLPFSESKLEFFGTDRAPLTTPPACGSYTTSTSILPWSAKEPVGAAEVAEPSSSFQVTSGPEGSACASPRAFAPGFTAGTTNIQAGAFTPFTLTMSRPDADQPLGGLEIQMPPGLLGTLAHVVLCPEAQANAGSCSEESLIGHTIVSAGLGDDPYTVTGGKVYITTGYGGAPYGLSIVNPAVAGPFVLQEGRPVIVRAQIFVNPRTAALTVKSGPLPTILDGVPLQIQHVNVTVERPGGFTFNPTNCSPLKINARIDSAEGATSQVSSPFQVTNCATLAFHPQFTVSTTGQTSKADGASLAVKLSYPAGSGYANIAKVKVDLPKQLPSRLTTLQKACLASQFEANPAGCPAASIVGHAKATTPVLPVPLEGPAYFVSHGGEEFPSLIILLQGYGLHVELIGATFIHKGITSSTFNTIPDAPVNTFELTLPQGPYSALAANANLCTTKLNMPTSFTAQNGAEIHQTTKITTTNCPKPKPKHKKTHKNHKKKKT
jgi:hypothetical protein